MDKVKLLEKELDMYMRVNKVMKKEIETTYQSCLSQKQSEIILSKTLARQKENLESKIENIKSEKHELTRRHSNANLIVTNTKKDLESLKRKHQATLTKNNKLEKLNEALSEELTRVNLEFKLLNKDKLGSDKEVLKFKVINSQHKREKAIVGLEIDNLKSRLQASRLKLSGQHSKLIEKDSKIGNLTVQLAKSKSDYYAKEASILSDLKETKSKLEESYNMIDNLLVKNQEFKMRMEIFQSKSLQKNSILDLENPALETIHNLIAESSGELGLVCTNILEEDVVTVLEKAKSATKTMNSQKRVIMDLNEEIRKKSISMQHLRKENLDLQDKIALKEEMELSYVQSIKQLSREQ